ncbi:ribonuclease YeeF family protein [Peribacillus simplex]|uniref:ribonuclease YeeF family protein n=1 Tax=Peribacillus simplex TaxID=1478 RepID=UPI0011DE18D9|nr:LXG domain-containing protein [Peribacillus simplex]
MKTLDSKSLHNGIEELQKKIQSQIEQLKKLESAIGDFSNLDDSFNGKGGKAIRAFYQEWHLPILSFHYYSLKNFDRVLTNLKKATEDLESDSNGFIRQSFLDGELTNGVKKIKSITTELVDETNNAIDLVSDIVSVQRLNDQQFHSHIQRANKEIDQTIEDLGNFDRTQTKELDSVEQDIQLMKSYISEIQAMFRSGELSVEKYNAEQLKEKPNFEKLESQLTKTRLMAIGNVFTSPFDPINQQMSMGDTILAGYQAASTIGILASTRKLQVHYFGKTPSLWQKIKGKYEFTVKTDPSWTSKGKHSDKLAKWLLNFARSPILTNPVMRTLQSSIKSYQSPAHLYKHLAGFPKNFDRVSGMEFMKGNQARMSTGTKEVIGKTITKSGLAKVGMRIPGVGTGISVVANFGELFTTENKNKSTAEKIGRFTGGFAADMLTIAAGAKIGATIGSVGGPVGIIVGGSVGALAGGIASSKVGDIAKDFGGKVGKEVDKTTRKIGSAITEAGGKLKKSISSWYN